MKKLFVFVVLTFMLSGCGKSEMKSLECTFHQNDVVNKYELNSTFKINYTGNYVDSVETVEEVSSEDATILEYFETNLRDTYSVMNDTYKGYTYEITNENGVIKSVVTIDYNKMDLSKYVEDQPTMSKYVKNGKMKFEGVKALYEEMGATCSK